MSSVVPRRGVGWLFLLSQLAWIGCGTDSETPAATFSTIYPLLFPRSTKAQCTFCHGLPANDLSNGNLAMGGEQATAYAALVNMISTSSMCGGMALVVPGDPEASLLIHKINGTQPCGDRMPQGGDPLPRAQVTMVTNWVAAGAQDD